MDPKPDPLHLSPLCVFPCTQCNPKTKHIPRFTCCSVFFSFFFSLLPFPLLSYHRGRDTHMQAHRHILYTECTHNFTRTKKKKEKKIASQCRQLFHPHKNTQAEKIEIIKRRWVFFSVHPSAEVVNHKRT